MRKYLEMLSDPLRCSSQITLDRSEIIDSNFLFLGCPSKALSVFPILHFMCGFSTCPPFSPVKSCSVESLIGGWPETLVHTVRANAWPLCPTSPVESRRAMSSLAGGGFCSLSLRCVPLCSRHSSECTAWPVPGERVMQGVQGLCTPKCVP